MDQTKALVQAIVEGMQEKKGKNIVTVDLSQTVGAICQYMVICEGNTPTQVWPFQIPYGILPAETPTRNRSQSTAIKVRNGSAWTMEQYWFISSYLSDVPFIILRISGQMPKLRQSLTSPEQQQYTAYGK